MLKNIFFIFILSLFVQTQISHAQPSCIQAISNSSDPWELLEAENSKKLNQAELIIDKIHTDMRTRAGREKVNQNTQLLTEVYDLIIQLQKLNSEQNKRLFQLRNKIISKLVKRFYVRAKLSTNTTSVSPNDKSKEVYNIISFRKADPKTVAQLIALMDSQYTSGVSQKQAFNFLLLASAYNFNKYSLHFPQIKNSIVSSFNAFNLNDEMDFKRHFTLFSAMASGQLQAPSEWLELATNKLARVLGFVSTKTVSEHYRNLMIVGAKPNPEIDKHLNDELLDARISNLSLEEIPLITVKAINKVVDNIATGLSYAIIIHGAPPLEKNIEAFKNQLDVLDIGNPKSRSLQTYFLLVDSALQQNKLQLIPLSSSQTRNQAPEKPLNLSLKPIIENTLDDPNLSTNSGLVRYLPPVAFYSSSHNLIIQTSDINEITLVIHQANGPTEVSVKRISSSSEILDAIYLNANYGLVRIYSDINNTKTSLPSDEDIIQALNNAQNSSE